MTLTPHPDSDILHELGAGVATAHRAFCRGFDAVRA
jgi:hypothetical protein